MATYEKMVLISEGEYFNLRDFKYLPHDIADDAEGYGEGGDEGYDDGGDEGYDDGGGDEGGGYEDDWDNEEFIRAQWARTPPPPPAQWDDEEFIRAQLARTPPPPPPPPPPPQGSRGGTAGDAMNRYYGPAWWRHDKDASDTESTYSEMSRATRGSAHRSILSPDLEDES